MGLERFVSGDSLCYGRAMSNRRPPSQTVAKFAAKSAAVRPTLAVEARLWQAGFGRVAGVDEAGRGALAGPVVAGAVIVPILPQPETLPPPWDQVRDSKVLSPARRETLFPLVQAASLAWGIGEASAQEIDQMGIAPATRLAMQRAIEALSPPPDHLIIDWVRLDRVNLPQESFVKGDARMVSIAAASILAKVHRDRLMVALGEIYPEYGFAQHKGYGATGHMTALAALGPCPVHRHTFSPIAQKPTLFDQKAASHA